MKSKHLYLILLLAASTFALSACSRGAFAATSWPGATADENTAYVAYNQFVYAINLDNGNQKWRFPAEADNNINFYATPVLTSDGQLIVGGYNNILYSLNPANGNENWRFEDANNRYIGGILEANGNLYAPNAGSTLYSLDSNGNLRWKFNTEGAQWAKPATNPGCSCIYLPSMDHHVYSIDSANGNQIWRSGDLGGSIVGSPTLGDDGSLYVGTFSSQVVALDPETGKEKWNISTDDWIWSGPVSYNGRIYIGDLSGTFYAINESSQDIGWQISTDGAIAEPPLILEDTLYITTEAGTLYALDLDGNTLWSKSFEGKLFAPAISSGSLILLTPTDMDQLVFALDRDGNQQWSFTPAK
jgi:outer membrane protein assembly factor BamB